MDENNQQQQQNQQAEKTFTQADVNRMMAAEKESGRRSILKELGVEDVTSAKEGLQKYQEYLNSQKTELQQAQENQAKLQNDYANAVAKANHAENCMTAMKAGASSDSIEDLVVLASSKVTTDKDFSTVIAEMKSNPTYSGFFKSSTGTGSGGLQNQPAGTGGKTSLAESLAKKSAANVGQKSKYFTMS